MQRLLLLLLSPPTWYFSYSSGDVCRRGATVGYHTAATMFLGGFVLLGLLLASPVKGQVVQNYCIEESFNATCPRDHVILMMRALYGRMKATKCINEERNVGCSTDVIQFFDDRCSGKKSCSVRVTELVTFTPCKKDYTSYLEAGYNCIKVPKSRKEDCAAQSRVSLRGSEGFIMHSHHNNLMHSVPGSVNCPWHIAVGSGQKVNITLLSLTSDSSVTPCKDKLRLEDGTAKHDVSICNSGQQRMRQLYTSKHNTLTMFLSEHSSYSKSQKFLLRYNAVGCADKQAPRNGWVKRHDVNTLMVKCNHTEETWYLTCTDNKWVGDIGNCTTGAPIVDSPGKEMSLYIPHGIVFAVLIGIVLGVTIGAILLFVVHCYKQRRNNSRKTNFVMVPQDVKEKYYEEGAYTTSTTATSCGEGQLKDPYPALLRDSEVYDTRTVPVLRHNSSASQPPQCFAVDNHNVHIKSLPHDKSCYPGDQLCRQTAPQCKECCVSPSGKPLRCDVMSTSARYTDTEQQF